MATFNGVEIPPDTVEESGLCQAGFHDSCDGYSREEGADPTDVDLCGCRCHDDIADTLFGKAPS